MNLMKDNLEGFRRVLEYLIDGEQEASNILLWIISNYKNWPDMIIWLKRNKMIGKRLIEMFQNESPDGGGYHLGASKIISMLDGIPHTTRMVKFDELR